MSKEENNDIVKIQFLGQHTIADDKLTILEKVMIKKYGIKAENIAKSKNSGNVGGIIIDKGDNSKIMFFMENEKKLFIIDKSKIVTMKEHLGSETELLEILNNNFTKNPLNYEPSPIKDKNESTLINTAEQNQTEMNISIHDKNQYDIKLLTKEKQPENLADKILNIVKTSAEWVNNEANEIIGKFSNFNYDNYDNTQPFDEDISNLVGKLPNLVSSHEI